MARNRNRTLIVLVLIAAAALIGGYTLLGNYNEGGGSTALPVDINTVTDITYTSRVGVALTSMAEGHQLITSKFDTVYQDSQIIVRVDFMGSVDAGSDFYGVLRTGLIEVESKAAYNEGTQGIWFIVFDMDNCLMGKHDYVIDFRGTYDTGDILMTGSSFVFSIDNQYEGEATPLELLTEPTEFQLLAGTEKTLQWKIMYINAYTVYLKIDGALVDSKAFVASSSPQTYTYTYSSDFNGEHTIVLSVDTDEISTVYAYVSGGTDDFDMMTWLMANLIWIGLGLGATIFIIVVIRLRR